MKTFEVLKVLNHNVLLGVNQGKEYILTGKGIGFQMKPGFFVFMANIIPDRGEL